jgi:hypothetical protein
LNHSQRLFIFGHPLDIHGYEAAYIGDILGIEAGDVEIDDLRSFVASLSMA